MSQATSNPLPLAPFQIESVHFDFPGGRAIHLVDPANDQLVGSLPEWQSGTRNELAAYVRGTRPNLRVIFRGTPAANGHYTVGADGTPIQIAERKVALTFDPITGLSGSEIFEAQGNLPNVIGLHEAKLYWYMRDQPSPAHCPPAGTSTHRWATTWRPLANAAEGESSLPDRVYSPLMKWTCLWAAGLDDEKEICDAILRSLPSSGLQYWVTAYTIRDLLLNQGGMCGAWYQTFQQMAQCQGVFVYRRCYVVHWRNRIGGEDLWCAIVIRNGGLNQTIPTTRADTFHDYNEMFPIPIGMTVSINLVKECRYLFWGDPNGYLIDGHCINFLLNKGKVYLYDPCFMLGPIELNASLPNVDLATPIGTGSLGNFKAECLDRAVDFMLGSIQNGPELVQTIQSATNGMTVRTSCIPELISEDPGLTFYWGD